MRRRRWGGLVGSDWAARAGVEVVLAGARAAPSAAPGRRRRVRVRVRVRLRGRVREAGGAVAIELQGGGVAAADLGREMTVVVSGIDGLARRRRRSRRRSRRGRRLVLGVQRVHEVRTHRGGGRGRAGGAEPVRGAPQLGCAAAGASGAARSSRGGRRASPPGARSPPQARPSGRRPLMPGSRASVSPSRRLPPGPRGLARPRAPPPCEPLPARACWAAIEPRTPGRPAPRPPVSSQAPGGPSAPGQGKECARPTGETLRLGFPSPRSAGRRKENTPSARCHLSPQPSPRRPLPALSPPPPRLPPRCAPARHFRTPPLRGEGARWGRDNRAEGSRRRRSGPCAGPDAARRPRDASASLKGGP